MNATLIKVLDGSWTGEARLYHLDTAIEYHQYALVENEYKTFHTDYVVVSATIAMSSGPETYIFPADSDGNVLNWGELDGSIRGTLDHEQALREAGYTVQG